MEVKELNGLPPGGLMAKSYSCESSRHLSCVVLRKNPLDGTLESVPWTSLRRRTFIDSKATSPKFSSLHELERFKVGVLGLSCRKAPLSVLKARFSDRFIVKPSVSNE